MYEIKLHGGGKLLGDRVTYEPASRKAVYIRVERSMGTAWLPIKLVKKIKEVE